MSAKSITETDWDGLTPIEQRAEMERLSYPNRAALNADAEARTKAAIRKRLERGESPESIRASTERFFCQRLNDTDVNDEGLRAARGKAHARHQRWVEEAIRDWRTGETE